MQRSRNSETMEISPDHNQFTNNFLWVRITYFSIFSISWLKKTDIIKLNPIKHAFSVVLFSILERYLKMRNFFFNYFLFSWPSALCQSPKPGKNGINLTIYLFLSWLKINLILFSCHNGIIINYKVRINNATLFLEIKIKGIKKENKFRCNKIIIWKKWIDPK